MPEWLDKMKRVSEMLKGHNPDNKKLKPLEKRGRGYQLYVKECEAEGTDPMSYDEWIKTQD